jgi:hypothetical protein
MHESKRIVGKMHSYASNLDIGAEALSGRTAVRSGSFNVVLSVVTLAALVVVRSGAERYTP